jgi:MFS family permease
VGERTKNMEEKTGSNSQAPTNTGNAAISITGNGGDEGNSNEKKMNISTKELLIKVILPFFIVCLTYHGVIVLMPIFLRRTFKSSDSFVGATTSIGAFGELLSSVPIGKSLAFFGTRRTLHISLVIILLSYILYAGSLVQEIVLIGNCLLGIGFNCYYLAQQTYITGNLPAQFRGKVFAYTDGTWQVSGIIGGLLIVMFTKVVGLHLAFICLCPFIVFTLISQIYFFYDQVNEKELEEHFNGETTDAELSFDYLQNLSASADSNGLNDDDNSNDKKINGRETYNPSSLGRKSRLRMKQCQILYDFRHEFLTLGVYCLLLMFVRYGRFLMIPLTGLSLDLTLSEIAWVSSASFFCSSLMFPLSGYIMDRCGRKTNSILTMFFMAVGFVVMYISKNFTTLLASGIIIGFGNGLSTGLVLALGGDYAPKDQRRGPFLSLFKLIYGSGQMFGPSMTGIASEYFGVQGGAILTVIACVFGIIWGFVFIVEKEPRGRDMPPPNRNI